MSSPRISPWDFTLSAESREPRSHNPCVKSLSSHTFGCFTSDLDVLSRIFGEALNVMLPVDFRPLLRRDDLALALSNDLERVNVTRHSEFNSSDLAGTNFTRFISCTFLNATHPSISSDQNPHCHLVGFLLLFVLSFGLFGFSLRHISFFISGIVPDMNRMRFIHLQTCPPFLLASPRSYLATTPFLKPRPFTASPWTLEASFPVPEWTSLLSVCPLAGCSSSDFSSLMLLRYFSRQS